MTPGSTPFDTAVRAWILAHQYPFAHGVSAWLSRVGSVSPLCWVSVLFAVYLFARRRRAGMLACVIAPLGAVSTYVGVRQVLPRTRPPSVAGVNEATNSFPSAHSTTSAAVCCAIAYVLWRENILTTPFALAVAIASPLLIGMSRVYLGVHWATDVLGGWVAGILIAAVARFAYQRLHVAGA